MADPNYILKDLELIEAESNLAYSFFLNVNNDWPYFVGHFPDSPVLPLMAVLDISLTILRNVLYNDRNFDIEQIKFLKALTIIRPGEKLHLAYEIKENKIKTVWSSTDQKEAVVLMSIQLNFKEEIC